jgi:hypothetical protein
MRDNIQPWCWTQVAGLNSRGTSGCSRSSRNIGATVRRVDALEAISAAAWASLACGHWVAQEQF